MKNKLVIVDDHFLIAQALTEIINHFDDFEVLYNCDNGKCLQEKFKSPQNIPNIILLDISMPIMNGFETASWLKENHPDVLILTLSMQNDDESVIKMIKNGAHGYLLKNSSPFDLNNALNKIIATGFFYPDWATKIVMTNLNAPDSTIKFTERELEFLKYTVTEMTYKEIADKMYCSPRTVEGYRDSLFEKLDLKTRVGLAVYAIKNNLD
jgi:DNA-binding NarL/FixJ family response regulator